MFLIYRDKISWSDKRAGPLLTLLQYIFVAIIASTAVLQLPGSGTVMSNKSFSSSAASSSSSSSVSFLRKNIVPLQHYAKMACLFAVMSLLNNLAFAFHISQPMHMVFRSANLMITYLFGRIFFGYQYSTKALGTITLLTAGALCNTFAEATVGDTAKKAAASLLINTNATVNTINSLTGCTGVGCSDPVPLENNNNNPTNDTNNDSSYMFIWLIGILILTTVLCLQSVLGEYQNWVRRTFTPPPVSNTTTTTEPKTNKKLAEEESMFYMHAMSVPILLMLLIVRVSFSTGSYIPIISVTPSLITDRFTLWSTSPPIITYLTDLLNASSTSFVTRCIATVTSFLFSLLGLSNIPSMWVFIILNVITQYICIRGVYALIGATDNLTVNVVLTVRKAVSVLVSIIAFGNTFTLWHYLGATLVFLGAYQFQLLPNGGLVSKPSVPIPSISNELRSSGKPSSPTSDAENGQANIRNINRRNSIVRDTTARQRVLANRGLESMDVKKK